MPEAQVRLSAGREDMCDELQALGFLAGANSIFYGEKLLTTGNPDVERDRELLAARNRTAESAPGLAESGSSADARNAAAMAVAPACAHAHDPRRSASSSAAQPVSAEACARRLDQRHCCAAHGGPTNANQFLQQRLPWACRAYPRVVAALCRCRGNEAPVPAPRIW